MTTTTSPTTVEEPPGRKCDFCGDRVQAVRRVALDGDRLAVSAVHSEDPLWLYEREGAGGSAPRVVAKGVDHVAQRIKQVARDSGVVCFENVPLARALHARCEIGDVIPEDLFEAVASVLAYVYRVQGERLTATAGA